MSYQRNISRGSVSLAIAGSGYDHRMQQVYTLCGPNDAGILNGLRTEDGQIIRFREISIRATLKNSIDQDFILKSGIVLLENSVGFTNNNHSLDDFREAVEFCTDDSEFSIEKLYPVQFSKRDGTINYLNFRSGNLAKLVNSWLRKYEMEEDSPNCYLVMDVQSTDAAQTISGSSWLEIDYQLQINNKKRLL